MRIEIDRDLVDFTAPSLSRLHKFTILRRMYCGSIGNRRWANRPWSPCRSNFPYNITTPLLFQLFDLGNQVQDMHFLLQKEVVDRLTAPVGSRNYSRLSGDGAILCRIDRSVYRPSAGVLATATRGIGVYPYPSIRRTVLSRHKDLALFSRVVKRSVHLSPENLDQQPAQISYSLQRWKAQYRSHSARTTNNSGKFCKH